jgi:hypothetical protein
MASVTPVLRAFDEGMNSGILMPLLGLVATLLATIIHEVGHLLAALATGQRDVAMNIGSHGTIVDRRLGEIRLRASAFASPFRPAG